MVQRGVKEQDGENIEALLCPSNGSKRKHRENGLWCNGQRGGTERNRKDRSCPSEVQRGSIERDRGAAYVQAIGQKGGIKRNREGRLCPREGQRGSIERDRGDRLWGSRGVKGAETETVKTKTKKTTLPNTALLCIKADVGQHTIDATDRYIPCFFRYSLERPTYVRFRVAHTPFQLIQ